MRKIIVALLILSIALIPVVTHAAALPNPNAFFNKLDGEFVQSIDETNIGKGLSGILWVLYRVGFGLAVILLVYIAIQMIIAPAQKKAEVKSALTPYIIGVLLLVAGVPIATLIIEIFITTF